MLSFFIRNKLLHLLILSVIYTFMHSFDLATFKKLNAKLMWEISQKIAEWEFILWSHNNNYFSQRKAMANHFGNVVKKTTWMSCGVTKRQSRLNEGDILNLSTNNKCFSSFPGKITFNSWKFKSHLQISPKLIFLHIFSKVLVCCYCWY